MGREGSCDHGAGFRGLRERRGYREQISEGICDRRAGFQAHRGQIVEPREGLCDLRDGIRGLTERRDDWGGRHHGKGRKNNNSSGAAEKMLLVSNAYMAFQLGLIATDFVKPPLHLQNKDSSYLGC